jgi:hypothetical protein
LIAAPVADSEFAEYTFAKRGWSGGSSPRAVVLLMPNRWLILTPLILSLAAQLVVTFRCCNVTMVRPDVVNLDCPASCLVAGSCQAESTTENDDSQSCCEEPEPASSCCQSTGEACCDSSSNSEPCGNNVGCTALMDDKKQGPDALVIDLPLLVAHPALPNVKPEILKLAQCEPRIGPKWQSSRQRRAALAIWII